MDTSIPTSAEIRGRLERLSYSQIETLSTISGTPLTTLWKIRQGDTMDPRLDTVGRFLPFVAEVESA